MPVAEEITRFADVVRRYCEWAEGQPNAETDMLTARKLLAELHLSIIDVPNLDCGDTYEDEVTKDDWDRVMNRFSELPVSIYSEIFDPLKLDEGSVIGDLSDDLSDIYRDLKEGLIHYQKGRINEAVWEWRFNFLIHWGRHLVGAQSAIHSYLVENQWFPPENANQK